MPRNLLTCPKDGYSLLDECISEVPVNASGAIITLVSSCVDPRLLDVLMQESRLYLIFEFLSMDLKKYLDSIPPGQYMDPMLVKVSL